MNAAARALLAALLVLASSSGHVTARATPAASQSAAGQPPAPIGAGTVRIGVLRNGAYEVVSLPLEVYVSRVLTGEAAPQSPPASLEALAVAIRTYTITNRGRHASEGFDLCDQTHCQVMRSATPATERASLATAEQILLFRGAPATVFYSASCGGRSEKPSNVWPGAADPSYLSIHDDDGCGGFPTWSAELAAADLQRAFAAGGYSGTLRDVKIVSRNDSGRVARLSLEGMTPKEITGQDLRMVVGRALGFQHIQSTSFELRRTGRAFRFTGRGAGHGVGMCVIGSMKLAARGQSASTILARYFPGTQLGSYGPRLTSAPREAIPVAPGPSALPAASGAPSRSGALSSSAAPSDRTAPVSPVGSDSPGLAPAPRSAGAASAADLPALPSDVIVSVPAGGAAERDALGALIVRERQALAQALGVGAPRVRLRVHETTDAYERSSGQPWFTLGVIAGDEIQLAPLELLRSRGMLERTVRRQLVHLMVNGVLPSSPAWVRVGAAVYFADPGAVNSARPPCPQDMELQRPTSIGALGYGLARARACFERQIVGGRDWRKVR